MPRDLINLELLDLEEEEGLSPRATDLLTQIRNSPLVGGGLSPENIISGAKFAGRTLSNVPESTARGITDIGRAIVNPVETLQAMGSIAAGGVAKGLGVEPERILGRPGDIEKFESAKQFFKDRYGSLEKAKKTIETDPFGALMDISGTVSGAGAAVRGAGTAGKVSRLAEAGRALETTGRVIDPLQAVGRGALATGRQVTRLGGQVGKLGVALFSGAEGVPTAAGIAAEKLTTKAGRKPIMEMARGGDVQTERLVRLAESSVNRFRTATKTKFSSGLQRIFNEHPEPINITSVKQRLLKTLERSADELGFEVKVQTTTPEKIVPSRILNEKGEPIRTTIQLGNKQYAIDYSKSPFGKGKPRSSIRELVERIGDAPDKMTPGELHNLKRAVDDLYSPSNEARAVLAETKSSLRQTIVDAIPEYKDVTFDYHIAQELMDAMNKDLAIGGVEKGFFGSGANRAAKKLTDTMKKNRALRDHVVATLQEELPPGSDIEAMIAGAVLQPWLPTGIVGRSALLGPFLATFYLPKLIPVLGLGSPRLVVEFLNALGHTREQASRMVDLAKKAGAFERTTGQTAFQAGRLPRAETPPESERDLINLELLEQ